MPINRPAAVTLDARSLLPATKTESDPRSVRQASDRQRRWKSTKRPIRARLRNEMAQLRPGRFSWDARNLGGNRWTIRLERIDENADGETFLTHVPAVHVGQGQHDQRARRADERAHL